jgi:hypothetical protein
MEDDSCLQHVFFKKHIMLEDSVLDGLLDEDSTDENEVL